MNTRRHLRTRHSIFANAIKGLLPAVAICFGGSALAQTYVGPAGTVGTPVSGNWNLATNWDPNGVPVSSNATDLTFSRIAGTGGTTVTATNDIAGVFILNDLTIDNANSTANAVLSIVGSATNSLQFQDNGADLASINLIGAGGTSNLNIAIGLGTNLSLTQTAAGTLNIGTGANTGINLNNFTLTLDGAGTGTTFFGAAGTGVVSGSGNIVINRTGGVTAFVAASTYSGGTTVNAGSTVVINTNSVGTGAGVTSGALGTGTVIINGGTFRATTTAPTFRTLGNAITVNGDFALGVANSNTGLNLAGPITLVGNRAISVVAGGTLADFTDRQTISGVIGESAPGSNFTKSGSGTLVVTGANTYTGVTNIANGSLLIGGNVASGAPSPLGNATSAVVLGGTGSASGNSTALLVGIPGATPGASTITVARDISVGAIAGAGSSSIGTGSNTDAVFSGGISLSKNVLLQSVSTGPRFAQFTGQITGGFGVTKTGAGQARLTNATNNFTGSTTVRAGSLLVAANVPASGDSVLGANATINVGDAGTLVTDAPVLAIDGAFDIARNLTVTANAALYTPTITATNATATTATYSGTITLNKTASLANATAGAKTLFTGQLTGPQGVTINGPGIVEFGGAGTNDYAGTTTIAGGTLRLNRNIGGNNTVTGPITLAGGTLQFAGANQLPDSLVLTMNGGVLDLAGFAETITDLNYTGGTILNGGNLVLTNSQDLFLFDGTTVATPQVINRHILYMGGTTAATVNGALALDNDPSHDLSVNDGTAPIDVIFNAAITNDGGNTPTNLIKKGNGTVQFNVANSFGGAGQTFELQGGTVQVTADNQLGDAANTITLSGGALRFASAFNTSRTFIAVGTAGSIDVPTGVVETISRNSQLTGSGTYNKTGAGELIISGDNSSTLLGGVSINTGTLNISSQNNVLSSGNITLNGGTLRVSTGFVNTGKAINGTAVGGTIQVDAGQTFDLPQAASIVAGTGAINKTGNGTLILEAANTFTATTPFNISSGFVEIRDIASLGAAALKANVSMLGGTLTLTNDTATNFANPVNVLGGATVVSRRLTAGAGVIHTLGTLSIGTQTLSVNTDPGTVTSGTQGLTFGATTFTGDPTFITGANTSLVTGAVALGNVNRTVRTSGAGTTTLGALTSGVGLGNTALTKADTGILILSASTGLVGNTVINEGILRANSGNSFGSGTNTNVVTINGGTLGMGSTTYIGALVFNGGTLANAGNASATGTWNGLAGPTPSITFKANTTFNLFDVLTPTLDADVNLGTVTAGVPTSVGPVNLVVNANATNVTALKKLRFNNTTTDGSVTGTLTINPNAIAQVRSAGGTPNLPSPLSQNSLGNTVLFKLNTGVNLTTPNSAGRLEVISDLSANFGNDVLVTGDSTINVQRIGSTATGNTMTLNDLSIGANTLAVVDAAGSNYSLLFDGITTLTGNATFAPARPLTLANITDGAGIFGLTKLGTSTMTINGGSYDGPTVVSAGTLTLPTANILASAGTITVTAGTLNLNAAQSTTGAVTVSGGTLVLNAVGALGGTITTTGGTVRTTVANSTTAANDFVVDGGRLDFNGLTTTVGDITATGLATSNALGVFTNNPTAVPGVITIDTLTVSGLTSNTLPNFTVNSGSGAAGTRAIANQVIITSGTTGTNSGAILMGANSADVGLEVGAGGLQISALATDQAYNAVYINAGAGGPAGLGTAGAHLLLNGDLTFTGNANNFQSTGLAAGAPGAGTFRGQLDLGGGNRTLNIGDGAGPIDMNISMLIVNGSPIKTGPGTLRIDVPATYAGNTTIAAGVIAAGANNVLPSGVGVGNVVINGGATATVAGTLDLNGFDVGINGLSGGAGAVAGQVLNSNSGNGLKTLTVGNGDATASFGGVIRDNAGTGGMLGLTKTGTGTQTLAGVNTYTGPTNVNAGALRVDGSIATTDVTIAAAAKLTTGSSQTLKSVAVGDGGTLELASATLSILKVGDNVNSTPLALGGAGSVINMHKNVMIIDYPSGSSPLNAVKAGIVAAYNGGTWTGVGIGSTEVTASTTLAPLLAVGYAEATSLIGGAGTVNFGGLTPTSAIVDADSLIVRTTLSGDADLDGTVNLNDLIRLANNYGTNTGLNWSDGDFDYSGGVDLNDLIRLANNYGSIFAAGEVIPGASDSFNADLAAAFNGAPPAVSVPEPATLGLAALGAAGILMRRRRRA